MSVAVNCWEYKHCGREPGGVKAHEMGVCPAATMTAADGYLGGKAGGRACAYVTGTFCSNTIQGTFRDKEKHCDECDFYKQLRKEHGAQCSVMAFSSYIKTRDRSAYEELTRIAAVR